jgi:hypothetical protein
MEKLFKIYLTEMLKSASGKIIKHSIEVILKLKSYANGNSQWCLMANIRKFYNKD